MYEVLKEAAPQAPALVVLVVLVFAFLSYLRFSQRQIAAMVDDATDVAKHCAKTIEDNTLIQGQVLEALRRSNGHTTIEPVQHIEADEAHNAG